MKEELKAVIISAQNLHRSRNRLTRVVVDSPIQRDQESALNIEKEVEEIFCVEKNTRINFSGELTKKLKAVEQVASNFLKELSKNPIKEKVEILTGITITDPDVEDAEVRLEEALNAEPEAVRRDIKTIINTLVNKPSSIDEISSLLQIQPARATKIVEFLNTVGVIDNLWSNQIRVKDEVKKIWKQRLGSDKNGTTA